MTVNEILRQAFENIQKEHGIAVRSANFELVEVSVNEGDDKFMARKIEFEAVANSRRIEVLG